MKSIKVMPIIFILFLMFIQRATAKPDEHLKLKIETPQDVYVLGEPPLIEIIYQNTGEDVIMISGIILNEEGIFAKVLITQPNGNVVPIKGCYHGQLYIPENIKVGFNLKPGKEIRVYHPIHTSCGQGNVFSEVGQYSVKVVFLYKPGTEQQFLWTGEVESNSLLINVTEPNEIDKAALPLIQEVSIGIGPYSDYYLPSFASDDEKIKTLEVIVNEHPASTYAKYAEFWLALSSRHYGLENIGNDDYQLHAGLVIALKELLIKYPQFSYTDIVKAYLALGLYSMGEYEECIPLLHEAINNNRYTREMRRGCLLRSYLADSYYKQGDSNKAKAVFKEALNIYPSLFYRFYDELEELGLENLDKGYVKKKRRERSKSRKKGCLFPF